MIRLTFYDHAGRELRVQPEAARAITDLDSLSDAVEGLRALLGGDTTVTMQGPGDEDGELWLSGANGSLALTPAAGRGWQKHELLAVLVRLVRLLGYTTPDAVAEEQDADLEAAIAAADAEAEARGALDDALLEAGPARYEAVTDEDGDVSSYDLTLGDSLLTSFDAAGGLVLERLAALHAALEAE